MKPIFKTSSTDKNSYTKVHTLAIDVSWVAQRHAHSLGQRFSTSDGRMSGHVYGAFKNIRSLIDTLRPDRIAFAYDRGYKWRSALLPDYKTNRKKPEGAEKFHPAPDVERFFRCFPGIQLAVDGSEADDMLGYLAANHEEEGALVIYSKDRDLWQLVNDGDEVACMFPRKPKDKGPKAKTKNFWVRESVVKSEFGVEPQNLAKLKALMGDTSDCIKGLRGGKKSGKKDALRAFARTASSDDYFNPQVGSPDLEAPDFIVEALLKERKRLLDNFRVTSIPYALERIEADPTETTEGSVAQAMDILAEFECESLLGQVEPLFRRL